MVHTTLQITISERKNEITEITPTTVTHGRSYGTNEEDFGAAHAVDKDLSTQSITETSDGAAWLKLEFYEAKFIHEVIVYYRFYINWYDNFWCAQSESDFQLCVDHENNVDVSVYQGDVKQKSCGTLKLTYGLEQSDQIYTLICNTKGDTVKLSKNTGAIAVYEVVVTSTGVLSNKNSSK